MSFGERLKYLRRTRGWTQEDVAQKLNIPRSTVGRHESNRGAPREDLLIKYANLFNTSLDYLLGMTDDPTSLKDWKEKVQGKNIDLADAFENQIPTYQGRPITEEEAGILLEFLRAYRRRKEKELGIFSSEEEK
jgi:transcriptional regulator with XRE-family HTH domain